MNFKKSFLFTNLFLIMIFLQVSCQEKIETSKKNISPKEKEILSGTKDQKVEYNLVEYFEAAESFGLIEKISFEHPDANLFFNSGWSSFQYLNKRPKGKWVESKCAVLDIPRSSTDPLKIKMDFSTFPKDEIFPEQSIHFYWNDHPLGEFLLDGEENKKIAITIPSNYQKLGINRVKIKPEFWINEPVVIGMNHTTRRFAALCGEVLLESDNDWIGGNKPYLNIEDNSIIQPPGSVISYSFPLPKKSTIRGKGWLDFEKVDPSFEGYLTLSLVSEKGEERILLYRSLQALLSHPEITFKEDLSEFSGEMVSINLVFSVMKTKKHKKGDIPKLNFIWENPRLTGKKQVPSKLKKVKPQEKYNIIIVLFDALRADHIEPYGNSKIRTPGLTKLASQGTTFLEAFSNTSWTRCSVTSLFTSLNPQAHKTLDRNDSLSQDVQYLPEILKGFGYNTTAIINNGNIGTQYGFARGYDQFLEVYKNPDYNNNKEDQVKFAWEEIIEPLIDSPGSEPFFLYIHERDPHAPYEPPAPWNDLYFPEYEGKISSKNQLTTLFNFNLMRLDEPDLKYLVSQYDGEITYMDRMLDWLNDKLIKKQIEKKTLVIFLSDHGEAFMDHGKMGHGVDLHEEQLRVPFIIKLPGVIPEGKKLRTPVLLSDIPPTILDLLGYNIPESMQGKSVLPTLEFPETFTSDRITTAQLFLDTKDECSARYLNWKLLGRKTKGYRPWKLYNLDNDPGEKDNVWAQEPVVGKYLLQMWNYQKILDDKTEVKAPIILDESKIDPKDLANLKALGYIR